MFAFHSHLHHPSLGPGGRRWIDGMALLGSLCHSFIHMPSRAFFGGREATRVSVQHFSSAHPPSLTVDHGLALSPATLPGPVPRWCRCPAGPRAHCCHSGLPVLSRCCIPCPQLVTASCLSRATSGLISARPPSPVGVCHWSQISNSRSLELYILRYLRKTRQTGDPSIDPSVMLFCSGSPCDWTIIFL